MGSHDSDLHREQVQFADGTRGRAYITDAGRQLPSVTTVLDTRVNPEKDDSIDGWRDWFDGSSPKRSPHWRDQLFYKRFRGTLAHYAITSTHGDIERSDEEDEAEERLRNWWAWKPTAYEDVPYDDPDISEEAFNEPACPESVYDSVSDYYQHRRDGDTHEEAVEACDCSIEAQQWIAKTDTTYDGEDAWTRAMQDISTITELFRTAWTDDALPITAFEDVETYVTDRKWGYAGQFDLLGTDEEGRYWVGDIKTSSGIRIDYKLQLAAYAHACDEDIHGLFIIRPYADGEDTEFELETHHDWDRSIQGLTNEFLSLVERTHIAKLPDFYDGPQ